MITAATFLILQQIKLTQLTNKNQDLLIANASYDSIIVIKDNLVAKSGHLLEEIEVKNKDLKELIEDLNANIDYYAGAEITVNTSGHSLLQQDTIYLPDSTLSVLQIYKSFSLFSQDSSIYVKGRVVGDSIYGDSMSANIEVETVLGVDNNGVPWTTWHSLNPNIQIKPHFTFAEAPKDGLVVSGGLFIYELPGVILDAKYKGYSLSYGLTTNGKSLIVLKKDFKLPWQ